jgi:hypothetical protein
MKKLIIVLLVVFCQVSFGQVYQIMPQYGYSAPRMNFDSTLTIPTFNGVPTLKSNITRKGALAIDSTNGRFYFYNPKNLTWSEVTGGGGSTDTTSLSNRINAKLSTSDSTIYYTKFRSDSSRTNIYNAINTKLNIVDTANKWVNNIYRIVGKDSIFFNIGHNTYALKDSIGTNPPASGYYGAFQDNTTQTAASINTAYAVKLNTTDLTNGVSVVNDGSSNPTRITLANTGIYNIQFSLQLEKTGGSGNMIADIWIRKNGVDIPSTTGKVVLTGSANASPIVAAWNYVFDLAAGDYIQLMWSTSNDNVVIKAAAATSPHPSIPSVILTVTQQSGIMAGTGITAINSITGAAQTIVTGTSGTDFAVSSTGTTHTFNLPTASATNRGALSSTDWSTFNGKMNYSDTTSLSNRINTKVNLSDTSLFQRKSIAAYSFQANNTNATANVTTFTFREQASQSLSSGITWNGTAPSGSTNHQYRWNQIGNLVTFYATLVYGTAGANNTQVTITLPADLPTPFSPTGLTSASNMLYYGAANMAISTTGVITVTRPCMLRRNSANNGFEILVTAATAQAMTFVSITIQYLTN